MQEPPRALTFVSRGVERSIERRVERVERRSVQHRGGEEVGEVGGGAGERGKKTAHDTHTTLATHV
jgi:hypothetical protein